MTRLRAAALLLGLAFTAAGVCSAAAHSGANTPKPRIVTVVKVLGIGWFERMQKGIDCFAAQSGVDAAMTGAHEATPASQIRILRRLIAEQPAPAAITVVPNSPQSIEPVLKQARAKGIKVVTHEASNQVNTDVDIEAFDSRAYGAHLMDQLAACMGGRGTYVAFVGHTSAQSHMEWVRAAFARAHGRYPRITRLGRPIESFENAATAYRKAKALLAAHANIRGFEGSSTVDVVGIGRAVRDAGLQRSTCVMGTSTPSLAGRYLSAGRSTRSSSGIRRSQGRPRTGSRCACSADSGSAPASTWDCRDTAI